MGSKLVRQIFELIESFLQEKFIRASGPGGQNVNKVSTAVQLKLDLKKLRLPEYIQKNLVRTAKRYLTEEGCLVIRCEKHRTQSANREEARKRMREVFAAAARRPKKRKPTSPSLASREKRMEGKKRRSEVKKLRQKPN